MKGKKIATRNKLSIFYSETDGYSVYAPDGSCLSSGYYSFANAERFCLNNTMFAQNKKIDNQNDKHSNVQEQEPCEDAISKQAVIDEIEYELEMINSALDSMALDFNARERLRQRKGEAREILNSIQQLPPVTPQPTRPFRKFTDLSKDEIKQIITDIFQPKKITNIETHKRDEEITCTIYTEWESYDDDGKLEIDLIPDTLILRNPFEYGDNAIHVGFSVGYDDYLKLKQFCFAKEIFHEDWVKNNPYLQEEEKSTKKQTDLEQRQKENNSER